MPMTYFCVKCMSVQYYVNGYLCWQQVMILKTSCKANVACSLNVGPHLQAYQAEKIIWMPT